MLKEMQIKVKAPKEMSDLCLNARRAKAQIWLT